MDIDKLITEARKNGNTTELEICQLIKAAFIENKHAKKPVSETDVLRKMVKEREKSEIAYLENNRRDLAKKEFDEIQIIKELLPKEPPIATLHEDIKHAIAALGYTPTMRDIPIIVKIINTKYPTAQKATIVSIFKSLI